MNSVSKEQVDKINEEKEKKELTLNRLKETSCEEMWLADLQNMQTVSTASALESTTSTHASELEPTKKKVASTQKKSNKK
jgi:predicted DNA-binding protein (UPF0251 family)